MQIEPFDAIFALFVLAVFIAAAMDYRNKKKCKELMGPIDAETFLKFFGGKEAGGLYFKFVSQVDDRIIQIFVSVPKGDKELFIKKEGIVNVKMFELVAGELYYLDRKCNLMHV